MLFAEGHRLMVVVNAHQCTIAICTGDKLTKIVASFFVVHDKTSQPLAYIHFEEKSGRLSPINQLTRDEALRIAESIAKLPELLETRNAPTETLRPAEC